MRKPKIAAPRKSRKARPKQIAYGDDGCETIAKARPKNRKLQRRAQ